MRYRHFREVQAIRLALNLSIGEFCAYAGINPGTYWDWKRKGRLREQQYQNMLALKLTVKPRVGPPPRDEVPARSFPRADESVRELLDLDIPMDLEEPPK
jgi:transcriptional regulator with XRE-family HTH domain